MTNEELAQFNSHTGVNKSNEELADFNEKARLLALNAEVNNHADLDDKLPDELEILHWGINESTKGNVILGEKSLATLPTNQHLTGFDEIALDFDHNSVSGSANWIAGKAKDIAAYGTPELVAGKGLFLKNIKWTPTGKKKALNYKDLSPAVKTDADGNVVWIHSAALTPNGSVYNLSLYSATDEIIKKENMDTLDYNVKGANAGLTKVGDNKFEVNAPTAENKLPEVKTISDKIKITNTDTFKGIPVPNSFKNQPWYYQKSMNTEIKKLSTEEALTKLAAEFDATGDANDSVKAKIIFAYLSEVKGLLAESANLIVPESAIAGAIKPYSAKLDEAIDRINKLETEKTSEIARIEKHERESLLASFAKEGKTLTLSAENQKTVPISILQDLLKNTVPTIPTARQFKILSADGTKVPTTREEKKQAFTEYWKSLANK